MENNNHNIQDDEFRVLGTGSPVPMGNPDEERRRRRLGGWFAFALVALLGLAMIVFWPQSEDPDDVEGVFESRSETEALPLLDTLTTETPCVIKMDTLVSGHLLKLFIPHRAGARLVVGDLDEKDRQAVMNFQAADIRADNHEILGEFVLAGEQLATGVSKKGFCAIIDGYVSVGVGESTPLLDEAIAKGGYFFRQYALVDGGEPVMNKPKNSTVRKALCDWNGQVFVAVSADRLTLDEFARVLADFGVTNAIYLIGSDFAYGWSVDPAGNREEFGFEDRRPEYQKQSYVLWE
jgi:hypothetical protein